MLSMLYLQFRRHWFGFKHSLFTTYHYDLDSATVCTYTSTLLYHPYI